MAKILVASATALQRCLEKAPAAWYEEMQCPSQGDWDVLTLDRDGIRYLVARGDTSSSPRAVIVSDADQPLSPLAPDARREALQRVHFVLLQADSPPVQLPYNWSVFHHDNLLAFFANARTEGANRWVAEVNVGRSSDVGFWMLTTPDDEIRLEEFAESQDHRDVLRRYRRATDGWASAVTSAEEAFESCDARPADDTIEAVVDLDATTFGAVTQHRTYSAWLEALTPQQAGFVTGGTEHPIKLRGPAGTGKTLALALKALRDIYDAQDRGTDTRVLFATHSWSMAEQIDRILGGLDEKGVLDSIDVYPLLEIARDRLPSKQVSASLRVLGEDSLEGKQLQLNRIGRLLGDLRQGDPLAYKEDVSPQLLTRIEAPAGSDVEKALIWDLMSEFGSVLAAHGILPGVNAERQYLEVNRADWMMPLESVGDKRLVLRIYSEYVRELRQERILTSDQLIRDFLNYLETFTWNVRRADEGYDLIFIDELHLFTEQERLVFHYLTRSAEEYPRLFMALDPRQAPFEVYHGLGALDLPQRDPHRDEQGLGQIQEVDLTVIYRFTPEILELIRHLHRSYPALDLGNDWRFDPEQLESLRPSGTRPTLWRHEGRAEEVSSVLDRAEELNRGTNRDERVAVVVVDPLTLSSFVAEASDRGSGLYSVIESRDEVENLRYARRRVVISAAEYVAGLQFAHVLVTGLPPQTRRSPTVAHQMRRFLSSLYLAASRASISVELHVSADDGDLPQILDSAVQNDVINIAK